MKTYRFLLFLVVFGLVSSVAAPSVAAGEPVDRLVTVVESGDFRTVPEGDGLKVVVDGFGFRMVPGKPMLPEKRVLIALPPGARVLGVVARGLGGSHVRDGRRIEPAPPIIPLAGPSRVQKLVAELRSEWRDNYEATYASDDAYPAEIARIVGSGSLRKYAYVSVAVCPVVYCPLSGRLTHYDAVEVSVEYSVPVAGSNRAAETDELRCDDLADDKARELFVNYEQVRALYQPAQPVAKAAGDTYDYVIVTTEVLAGAVTASDFVSWKTTLGHSVRTVLTTDPEITTQPGSDLAEQIRNFLRSYYATWGIQYVLMVGDYATVPMRYCFPDPDDHTHNPGNYGDPGGSVPTDFYYADLSLPDADSWDLDGDGYRGEYLQDAPDFLAEVYVGRVPTNDLTRITYALDKCVDFEYDSGAWKEQALQPGSILFYENQDYGGYPKIDGSTLLNHIETNLMSGWTVSRYTEREGLDPSAFPWPAVSLDAFINDWRTGQYGVVNWSGHGAPYGVARTVWEWDDGDGVPETDGSDVMAQPMLIDAWCALDDDYPSIVFAVSCNVGYPEPNGVGNLGIDLFTKPGFGAAAAIVSSSRPAYISADVIANPGGAESVCYEFNRFGIQQGESMGRAMYDAKYYCFLNYGWDHFAEYANQYNFDLYGDPSMFRKDAATAVGPGPARAGDYAVLLQNRPNPFNPTTEIVYTLRRDCWVKLEVFDVRGARVATLVDEYQHAGQELARWDGRRANGDALASGVYFYRLRAGNHTATKKMVLVK